MLLRLEPRSSRCDVVRPTTAYKTTFSCLFSPNNLRELRKGACLSVSPFPSFDSETSITAIKIITNQFDTLSKKINESENVDKYFELNLLSSQRGEILL